MRTTLSLAALALALAGCHEQKKDSAVLPPAEANKIQARAEQAEKNAFEAKTGVAAETRVAPVAEAEAPMKAKVLNADPRGCTWVEAEGLVTVSEDMSRNQARASAYNAARDAAMRDFFGVKLKSRTLDFQQEGLRDQKQVIETMLLTTREGRALDEKVVSESSRDLPGCPGCRYALTLRTCLQPRAADADKDFFVDLGISRNRLVEGDEVKLNVTATRDCYLYVYDLWQDFEKAALIVPNQALPEIRLKAGQTWEYPDKTALEAGVTKLEAQLPQGSSVSAETVRVIASKTPLPFKTYDPAAGFLTVLQRMNASKIEWAEDAQVFTITKR